MNEEALPNFSWSFKFLKIMLGIIIASPLVGALIYLLFSQFTGSTTEPLDSALRGAKVIGLVGGFAAPLIALGLVTREIGQRSRDGRLALPPETDS